MKEIAAVLAAVALTLAIIGVSLGLLGDRSTLTSPPDAVAEGFVRMLQTAQYERALPYLDDSLREHVDAALLRDLAHRLQHRTGTIIAMAGEPVWISTDSAVAAVVLEAELVDSIRLEFPLGFSSGVWSLSGLGTLADTGWSAAPTGATPTGAAPHDAAGSGTEPVATGPHDVAASRRGALATAEELR